MTGPALALPVHRLHDEEVERLLAAGERRAELTALFGDKGYRELSALARRAAARRGPAGTRVSLPCRGKLSHQGKTSDPPGGSAATLSR